MSTEQDTVSGGNPILQVRGPPNFQLAVPVNVPLIAPLICFDENVAEKLVLIGSAGCVALAVPMFVSTTMADFLPVPVLVAN